MDNQASQDRPVKIARFSGTDNLYAYQNKCDLQLDVAETGGRSRPFPHSLSASLMFRS